MATAISSLTIEELKDIVTKSIDQKLQESLGRSPESSQNQNQSPNRPNYNAQFAHYRHSPRYQNYNQNSSPHYNNSSPHYNNNSPHYNNNSPHYNNNSPRYNDYQYSPRTSYNNSAHNQSNNSAQSDSRPHSGDRTLHSNQTSPNKYQIRQRRYHEIQPLKIMITYVETACTFWGQVLTPDLLDATRQLETDLQEMCPGLSPVVHITKGGVYGTLWCDRWYRCITCQIPDEKGNTEVLFVDYGNKEKKNIADLVSLRSPKLMEVPFFAYPFRFPKLEALPDKLTEAVGNFDTESILTGFVSQTPCSDVYTDIYVNRPQTAEHTNCTTYNELMVELGFAKKSEESVSVRRPQPSYYTQALQHRIKLLTSWCRDKDQEIARLTGGQQTDIRSPFHDIRYSTNGTHGDSTNGTHGDSTNGTHGDSTTGTHGDSTNGTHGDSTPKRVVTPSHMSLEEEQCDLPAKLKQQEDVLNEEQSEALNEEALNEDVTECLSCPVESMEEVIQSYIFSLIDKMYRYNSTAAQIVTSTDTRAIRSVLEQIDSGGVGRELEEQRSSVEKELQSLAESSASIQGCTDSSSLHCAVEKRDQNLLAVSEAVERYVKQAEQTKLHNKYQIINEIVASFEPPPSPPTLPSQSLDWLLERVEEMGASFVSSITTVHGHCTDQLRVLNRQLLCCSRLLNQNVIRSLGDDSSPEELGEDNTPEELGEDNIPEELGEDNDTPEEVINVVSADKHNIASLGETLKTVCSLLEELLATSLQHSNDVSPLSDSVQSVVNNRAVERRKELEVYVTCSDQYQKKALSARHTLQNKPDLSSLTGIKKQLKVAKRQVKLTQITDDEDEDSSTMRESMIKLHRLYQSEEEEFASLLHLAQTTHPELLIQHPQLKAMSQGDELLKSGWELHEFVLPDTSASINNQGLNVYSGFYCDLEPVYFVERALQTVEGSLEDHALHIIRETLPDHCFAVILNKKSLRVYGASTQPPV